MLPPIDQLQLDNDDQNGLSKLYVMERLIEHYGGNNGLVDSAGYVNQGLNIGFARVSPRTKIFLADPLSNDRLSYKASGQLQVHIMYSEEPTAQRMPGHDSQQPTHLMLVRLVGSTWEQYNTGNNWQATFVPQPTDRILFDFDMGPDTVTDLVNTDSVVGGIRSGYWSTDITIGGINPDNFIFLSAGTFIEV